MRIGPLIQTFYIVHLIFFFFGINTSKLIIINGI
jgi:hypothetical protein